MSLTLHVSRLSRKALMKKRDIFSRPPPHFLSFSFFRRGGRSAPLAPLRGGSRPPPGGPGAPPGGPGGPPLGGPGGPGGRAPRGGPYQNRTPGGTQACELLLYCKLAPGQQRVPVPALRLMMATRPARLMTWRLSDDALDGRAGHMRRAIYTGGRCLHGARQRTGVSGRGGSAYEQLYSSLHGPESRRASGLRGRGTRRVSGRMWMRGLLPMLSTVRTGPSGM